MKDKIFNEEDLENQLKFELSLYANRGEQYQKGFSTGFYSGVTYAFGEICKMLAEMARVNKKLNELEQENVSSKKVISAIKEKSE